MAQPRLVLVDDTNPSIQYSGPWFEAQNTQDNIGDFGPPFENTLHGVTVNASFSFSFSGSLVTVMGTSTDESGTQDLSWECFVDNINIGSKPALSDYAENNWIFCQDNQLKDGPHVLTLKATVSDQQTFWFDQIQYLPSTSVSLSGVTLRIDPTDPAIQYSTGWSELNGIAEMTQTSGSTITFVFSGVSLSFVGYLPPNYPLTASSATYSIDGQTPTNFFVPTGAAELYNQVFFQTGQLSAGQHKLVVTHQGNAGTSPLALNYFVVQGSSSSGSVAASSLSSPGTTVNSANSVSRTATSTTSGSASFNTSIATGISTTDTSSIISSSGVSSPSSSSSSSSSLGSTGSSAPPRSSRSRGAIIGGVLGAFVLLLLLLTLIFCYRKRKKQGAWRSNEKPEPFNALPTATFDEWRHTSRSQQQPLSPRSPDTKIQWRSTIGTNFHGRMTSTSSSTTPLAPLRSSSLPPTVMGLSSPMTTSSMATMTKGGQIVGPMQQPVSRQDDDSGYVRAEYVLAQDSGDRVRIELPPLYTLD